MAHVDLEINGKTRLLGIVGQNIGYTMSPGIHNFSAQLLGKNNAYVPFDLPFSQMEAFLEFFWNVGGLGFNVTTPYKELVARLVRGHNFESVNTVYRGPEGWLASSTDAEGLASGVRLLGTNFKSFKRFVILGSGGVVAAILNYIARDFDSTPEVIVLRRNAARDVDLLKNLPKNFNVRFVDFSPEQLSPIVEGGAGETLLIQASSAPHNGDNLSRFSDPIKKYNGVFVDIVYGAESALLDAAKARGIPCQDGLPMLIEQARIAQRFWWGESAPFNEIYKFLRGEDYKSGDD